MTISKPKTEHFSVFKPPNRFMDQKIPTILFLIFLTNPIFSQSKDLFYSGFDDTNDNITLSEGAFIEKNGILRLTNNTLRLKGEAFYSSPIQFKNKTTNKALSFSTSFAFSIFPQYPGLGGHGFAFAISPSKYLPNALPSQYLGLLNSTNMGNFSNHIVAVEFDTVQDFEFEDINDNHVGIDINSLVSNKSAPASYFMENSNSTSMLNLSLKSGQVIQAWIDYDSIKNHIEVRLSIFDTKPLFPILSYDVDLSEFVKDYMFVGFSSSTGLLASTHYILGWSFTTSGEAKSLTLSSLPSLPRHGRTSVAFVVYVSVSVCLAVVLVIAVSVYFVRKIKNREVIEEWEFEVGPHRFSYQELKKATRGFRDKELLGFGGFGKVYKGTLRSSNTQVAIKRISNESKQGLREFVSEIASMGRLRHRNLVQLLGWCRKRSDLLLVYDFMPNGSLDKYLFDEPKRFLTWDQRFNIIKGIASGLLYLHEEWEQTVIHRDIKAGNVLLDSEMNGRLGDFGLAKLYDHGSNPSTTKVVGTLGYLAPELTRTGKPNKSSDVYAIGALMLEVVCGRRPIEPKALPEELILVDWVWEKWTSGAILDVVDRRLNGEFDELEAVVLLKLGLMCSNNVPDARPTMRQIVRYLEGDLPLPIKVTAPDGKDEKKSKNAAGVGLDGRNCGCGRGGDEEHEEYVHSYQVSSGDECGGHIDLEAGSAIDEFR